MRVFCRNGKRNERLAALSAILEYGSEEQYLELLAGWRVPSVELNGLLNEFREKRREKKGLR